VNSEYYGEVPACALILLRNIFMLVFFTRARCVYKIMVVCLASATCFLDTHLSELFKRYFSIISMTIHV